MTEQEIPQDPPIEPVVSKMPPTVEDTRPTRAEDATINGDPLPDTSAEAAAEQISREESGITGDRETQELLQLAGLATAEQRIATQQSITEPQELARLYSVNDTNSELPNINAKEYFQTKQEEGLFTFKTPEQLAEEIEQIEGLLIGPIREQIKSELPNLGEIKTSEAIANIRESLFALVLDNKLSAEKICAYLQDNIVIKKEPSEAVPGSGSQQSIVASCNIESGQAVIYLYENYFTSQNKESQSFHLIHELSHAMSHPGIWSTEVYQQFQMAAQSMKDEDIAKLNAYPELIEVLTILRKPVENAPAFRSYLRDMMVALDQLPDEQQAQQRIIIAEEILTDLTTYYLKSDGRPEGIIRARLKHLRPEGSIEFIMQRLGVNSPKDALEKLGIDPKTIKPEELIQKLIESPELAPFFGISKTIVENLKEKFKDGGANISIEINEEGGGQFYEYASSGGGGGGFSGGSESVPYSLKVGPNEDLFSKFFALMTGKGSGGPN